MSEGGPFDDVCPQESLVASRVDRGCGGPACGRCLRLVVWQREQRTTTRSAPTTRTQIPVLTGLGDQADPAASGSTLAWAQGRPDRNCCYTEYVRVGSAPRVRVNPPGTTAGPGGISGMTLVYRQATRRNPGSGDIRFYDIAAQRSSTAPAGWNTTAAEINPTISGNLVLFGREFANRSAIYLGHRSSGVLDRLVTRSGLENVAGAGEWELRGLDTMRGGFQRVRCRSL